MSWGAVNLGDVCGFVRGPFGGSLKKEIFKNEGYAVFEQQHAINDQFSEIRYFVDEAKFLEMKRFELAPGDLIMSCSGTMGKVAIVPNGVQRGIINQALLKISPQENVDVNFLRYWMESDNFQRQLSVNTSGAAIKNVASVGVLKELKIPLPPLEEQKRIARILDQADTLRRLRTRALDKLNTLGQAIFHDMFGEELKSSNRSKLAHLIEARSSLDDPTTEQNAALPHVGPEHIASGSGQIAWNSVRTCAEDGVTSGKYVFQHGDVIYSKIRPYLDKVAISDRKGMCSADMYALHVPNGSLTTRFLHFVLGSADFLAYAATVSNRANIPKMNRKQLFAYETVVPSMDAQNEFVEKLRNLEAQRSVVLKQAAEFETLFASLQHRAFRGEL